MYLTFKNNSTNKMTVTVENQKHIINPEDSVEVFCASAKVVFEAQTEVFNELTDAANEVKADKENYRLKDKILAKLAVKFVDKLPETVLDLSVKYGVNCSDVQNTVINLFDGVYSVCDGKVADFFDMVPVFYMFSRAETETESIRVVDVTALNRKKFLKLVRNLLLFFRFGLYELIFFVPEYFSVKFYSSHFFINRLVSGFYEKTAEERSGLLSEKEKTYETEEKKGGCLKSFVKVMIVLLILGGIVAWILTSEPDVIVSEDLNSVVCFDEKFIKIEGGLPSDAEDIFLEDYYAYYPLEDGEYDSDSYYCYIYETPDGTRYMWLKDNCRSKDAKNMDYDDYENPLVYKSVGEISE